MVTFLTVFMISGFFMSMMWFTGSWSKSSMIAMHLSTSCTNKTRAQC